MFLNEDDFYSVRLLVSRQTPKLEDLSWTAVYYGVFNIFAANLHIWRPWLWNMVSYITGEMQTKGIWKQDPEANIWAQEGWEWGVEKTPQWGTS